MQIITKERGNVNPFHQNFSIILDFVRREGRGVCHFDQANEVSAWSEAELKYHIIPKNAVILTSPCGLVSTLDYNRSLGCTTSALRAYATSPYGLVSPQWLQNRERRTV